MKVQEIKEISKNLRQSLRLAYEPVGVTLYRQEEALPSGLAFTSENLKSYCQALVLAGQGRTLLLKRENMGCKLGTAVLGMEPDTEAILDDGILEKYGVGLFATEEASARTIMDSTYLEKGKTQAVLIAPLSACPAEPQVVVFTVNSEQVMWLLYAANYERGGRQNLPQSGGALGGCSDITALPLLTGLPNITFLGLGCRIKTGLDACHLMMGINVCDLAPIHAHIQSMAKPIAMLFAAQGK
ncbi:MAG: DUF169 domain-containing protein [Deltaproteobacteria bacterium]|nr:DUF169 domain-containing protein [Deltaproteobacteria bacterium]